jgi:hypothetical protein
MNNKAITYIALNGEKKKNPESTLVSERRAKGIHSVHSYQ